MENKVLNISNLTKVFKERVAVNNVSFSLMPGEIFGFIGANGAGKTTTMKMICGLTHPTSGNIEVCGYDIKTNFEKAAKNFGGIIETPLMYGYMSGYDNLKYYATLHNNVNTADIIRCAQIVGLEYRINDKVKKYSLGMKQRLGIAQSLLHNPKLLILDEPLSGLDPNGVKEMRDFLRNIAKVYNIAILISSHMLSDMELLCDTIGIIDNGNLIEIKTVGQLKKSALMSNKLRFKVDYPNFAAKIILNQFRVKVEVVGNSAIVHTSEDKINEITKSLISYNISIFGVESVSKSLEEMFIEIIKQNNANKSTSIL